MEFEGFRTVASFKHACTQFGITITRRTIQKEGDDYILITMPPKGRSSDGKWWLFNWNQAEVILFGIIPSAYHVECDRGMDMHFQAILNEEGFYL